MAIRNINFPELGPQPVPPLRRRARWKKIVLWTGSALVVLLVLLAVTVAILLHSQRFHKYVLATAEQQLSDTLNTRVTVENFTPHFSDLGLDIYGVTIYGVGPGANLPLLQTDHLKLSLRVVSLWHRRWYLDDVVIGHPVVSLLVTKSGATNIPTPKPSNGPGTNIFDLAVRHVQLSHGEVYDNDRKSDLSADLHDLDFVSNYDSTGGGRYFGNLSYRNGQLRYGAYEPLPHNLSASFDARRTQMSLSNVVVQVGESTATLNATLQNYDQPHITAKYSMQLSTAEAARILKNPSVPAGVVAINGTADYDSVPGRAALQTLALDGTVQGGELAVRQPGLRTEIRNLSAAYHLRDGNAEVRDVRAGVLGGLLTADATVRDLAGKAEGHATAAIRGASLANLQTLGSASSRKTVVIAGRISAQSVADWTGNMNDLVARLDAVSSQATMAPPQQTANVVPVEAAIHARYRNAGQEITLNKSYVRTAQTSVDLDGTVSRRSALQVNVQANDLHELETVAALFQPPQPSPQPLGLQGNAAFTGTVRGSLSAPQIAGQLTASNVQLRGSSFPSLRTSIAASPSMLSLQNGDLQLAPKGRLDFSVQAALRQWSFTPHSAVTANIKATSISIAEAAKAANISIPATGTISANVNFHGTQDSPAGQGDVSLVNAVVEGEPIKSAEAKFQGTGDALHANLLVRSGAGSARADVTYYPKQQGYDGTLQALNVHLGQLQSLKARNIDAAGTLNLTASGKGTFSDPSGQLSLTIPSLELQKQRIENVDLHGSVGNHQANFLLTSSVLNTPLRAQGKVGLTGDYYADATLDTPVIQLQPLVAVYAPAQAANLTGQTEIHASLRGPLKNKQQLEVHLNVPTLAVTYRVPTTTSTQAATVEIASAGPIRADYAGSVLTLQQGEIKGTGTDLHFSGKMPFGGANAPATLNLKGTVDLALAQMFNPDINTSGQLQLDVNAAGLQAQDMAGEIRIVNAQFSTLDAPVGLAKANGVLTLRRDRMDVTSFTGTVGGGTVIASGSVVYRPNVQFHLALNSSGMRMLYPAGVRTDLSMNLAMTGSLDAAVLQGQINIDRLSFTPDFDLSTFIAQFSGVSTPAPEESFSDRLKLNIALRSGSELNAVSPGLSLQGDANLRIVGTATEPVILGRANLSGGDLIFLGNRYVVQGGTLAFVNTIETRPVVNLQVTTKVQQYDVAMRFQGPVDRLRTTYTSNPSLPQADIINLLAFGQTTEQQAANPQSTTAGAESLVASQVSGQVTGRIQKVAGISQLSVDPVLTQNGNEPPGARITIQQRVTSKLYVTFSSDVTSTASEQVQVEYRINKKWSVSTDRDQNGGFGLDGRYHKDF